jgi:hypothetical protein
LQFSSILCPFQVIKTPILSYYPTVLKLKGRFSWVKIGRKERAGLGTD